AKRGGKDAKSIPRLVTSRLAITTSRSVPRSEKTGTIERQGYHIEKIALKPEAGITIPALAFVTSGGATRKPAGIYINREGKAGAANEGGSIETIVRGGNIVLAIDPRGWGETSTAPTGTRSADSSTGKLAMRGILVGKPLAGMQTADVL